MSTVRDLIEEAKKRIVFLIICVVGLSYLMSLTSSSVLVNLPAAAFLIIVLRYLSLDFDMRRKAAALNQKPSSANISSKTKPLQSSKAIVLKSAWRRKVNSPIVEAAIDQFTRHLVSEWVTDLWYSRITPDRQGPEELVQIINGVLGELASRMRNINLIDFLTRDVITLICTHLELYRISQTKIEKQELGLQSIERRDMELKYVLAAEKKLHPALFSAEAEHKVLQHLMDGLISFTFKPEDLQCSLFRYIVRELLACTVMRPVLNLASPRFINDRIESLVISSKNKANKRATTAQVASQSSPNGSLRISTDHSSRFIDPSAKGVELMQLKKDQSKTAADNVNGTLLSKDPLLSIDTGSTRSWNSLLSDSQIGNSGNIQKHHSGGEWGDKLDSISRKKTEGLAPEHFENVWSKGRNYRKNGAEQFNDPVSQSSSARTSTSVNCSKALSGHKEKNGATKVNPDSSSVHPQSGPSYVIRDEHNHMGFEDVESGRTSSYTTEDEEPNSITGLDSPGTKVWDGKSNRNVSVPHIHHPLESSEGHKTRKTSKGRPQTQRLPVTVYGRKRSRLSGQRVQVWQEVDRTSFLSGDGQDLLHSSKRNAKLEDSSEGSETEILGRIGSGAAASSSAPSLPIPESHSLDVNALKNSLLEDSFFKLRCEVLGANIVKSGSKTFAVYSVSVTDLNNNSWSIKRRFRHFEELHRRLKEFPEYNLHLPPKHFLSTGLDVPVIQERCNLLDKYLKKLLQLPTVSRSIEVWDFLSVDSQTYVFSNSISIIETLSDNSARERNTEVHNITRPVVDTLSSEKGQSSAESKESPLQTKGNDVVLNGSGLDTEPVIHPPPKKPAKEPEKQHGDSGRDSENFVQTNISSVRNSVKTRKVGEDDGLQASSDSFIDDATDPTLPTEWVPPNLSVPIFDLVDVIFQLQDGGWIRRKAFWVAKQVLQLGMGDAFDDWLIEKIQLLRRGSVVASGIRRVEQILWPDGIFITKHPKRQRPAPSGSPTQSSPHGRPSTPMSSPKTEDILQLDEQRKEAERRAKFVYELMIDNAPAALVGLFGRKEYEQCAKDLYYFLQSSVCLKQLAFDFLELLLLSALPEMDYLFRQIHEEKEKFGEFKPE